MLINEDNNENKPDNNKSLSDKNNQIFINEESSTSKVNINSDKKKLNSTFTNLGLKEKIKYNNSNNGSPYDNKSSSEKSNICRICYCDEIEMNSPLLNLSIHSETLILLFIDDSFHITKWNKNIDFVIN